MTAQGWTQILFFFLSILAVAAPLGVFMYRVLEGENHFLSGRSVGSSGSSIAWAASTATSRRGSATRSRCWSSARFAMLVTYAIQRLQHVLPFNPQGFGPVEAGSAFNTAASFTTNTNWQGYAGESTMSYLTQMAGLAWHNFISAAAGHRRRRGAGARPDAPRRGQAARTIGNFWVDLIRATRLRPAADLHRRRAGPGVAGRDPEPRPATSELTTLEGAKQTIAHGAGGLAGGDQAARHQRRRLLQRQRRAPVREPDAAHELPLDAR